MSMLPKSSETVSEIISRANTVAREFEQEYVGTEHLLIALLECGVGKGSESLVKAGVTEGKLRAEVERLAAASMEETWVFGRLPGTPHFKNVMAAAIDECRQLGAKEVESEHILLALAREQGSVACQALENLGVNYDALRSKVSS